MVKRDIDSQNLIYHPKRVAEWLEKKDCFPIYVEVGPTSRCNHKCIFCALDWLENKKSDISTDLMNKTLEEMAYFGVKSVMFAGEGEPLLHKDIASFVKTASENGMSVAITSNGVLFGEEKAESCLPYLSWIRFSIDAGSRDIYSEIHQTNPNDFDKVIKNIRIASEIKKRDNLKVNISTQILMIPQNIDEVIKLAEISKKAGADNIQVKPYSQHPSSKNKFVVKYKDYDYIEKELEKFNSKSFQIFFRKNTLERKQQGASYDSCYGLPFFTLIDSQGNILPCNLFYGNEEFTYGNLYENSFQEIWKSTKRKKVLKKLKQKGVEECREVCRLDAVNRYLYTLLNFPDHKNFI
jgi:radical SAM protein with 4Fe4S-binding SPASM domain